MHRNLPTRRQFLRQPEPATEFNRIADCLGEEGLPVLVRYCGVRGMA